MSEETKKTGSGKKSAVDDKADKKVEKESVSASDSRSAGEKAEIMEKLQSMGVAQKDGTASNTESSEKRGVSALVVAVVLGVIASGSFVWYLNRNAETAHISASENRNDVAPVQQQSAYNNGYMPPAMGSQPGAFPGYAEQQQYMEKQRKAHEKWLQQQQQARKEWQEKHQQWLAKQRAEYEKWLEQQPTRKATPPPFENVPYPAPPAAMPVPPHYPAPQANSGVAPPYVHPRAGQQMLPPPPPQGMQPQPVYPQPQYGHAGNSGNYYPPAYPGSAPFYNR